MSPCLDGKVAGSTRWTHGWWVTGTQYQGAAEPARSTSMNGLIGEDGDFPAFEHHLAIPQCEERVITPQADVQAGQVAGAALPNEDGASLNPFSGESLHPQKLGAGITALSCITLTLFMCHKSLRSTHDPLSRQSLRQSRSARLGITRQPVLDRQGFANGKIPRLAAVVDLLAEAGVGHPQDF